MKQKNSHRVTVKWILLFVVAIGVGTFMTDVLENTAIHIWLARGIGALITGIIGLLGERFWIKKAKS